MAQSEVDVRPNVSATLINRTIMNHTRLGSGVYSRAASVLMHTRFVLIPIGTTTADVII